QKRKGLQQALHVRVFAFVRFQHQPRGYLRVLGGELRSHLAQERQLSLVVEQQVIPHPNPPSPGTRRWTTGAGCRKRCARERGPCPATPRSETASRAARRPPPPPPPRERRSAAVRRCAAPVRSCVPAGCGRATSPNSARSHPAARNCTATAPIPGIRCPRPRACAASSTAIPGRAAAKPSTDVPIGRASAGFPYWCWGRGQSACPAPT